MLTARTPISVQISPLRHAYACFVVAVVLFSLAAGAYYWNESVHYRIYVALGLVFAIIGFVPLVLHTVQSKSK